MIGRGLGPLGIEAERANEGKSYTFWHFADGDKETADIQDSLSHAGGHTHPSALPLLGPLVLVQGRCSAEVGVGVGVRRADRGRSRRMGEFDGIRAGKLRVRLR